MCHFYSKRPLQFRENATSSHQLCHFLLVVVMTHVKPWNFKSKKKKKKKYFSFARVRSSTKSSFGVRYIFCKRRRLFYFLRSSSILWKGNVLFLMKMKKIFPKVWKKKKIWKYEIDFLWNLTKNFYSRLCSLLSL